MKLTRKIIQKLIKESLLKEFKEDKLGSGGGMVPPYVDPGDGGGRRLTPCENSNTKKFKDSYEIVDNIFAMALPNGIGNHHPEIYDLLLAGEYDRAMPIYIIQDIATDFCKGYLVGLKELGSKEITLEDRKLGALSEAEVTLFNYLQNTDMIRNYTDEYLN